MIYFKDTKINELFDVIDNLNIEVLSYLVDGEKYYARNKEELLNNYIKENNINALYVNLDEIKIDGINVYCEVKELINIEKQLEVY